MNWKKDITILVVLVLIFLIWHNSWLSAAASDYDSRRVARLMEPLFRWFGVKWSMSYIDDVVRKMAHAFEYMVLCIAMFIAFGAATKLRGWRRFVPVMIIVVAVASIDETIQLFSPGRAGMWQDVVLDSCGGLLGFIIASIVRWLACLGKSNTSKP